MNDVIAAASSSSSTPNAISQDPESCIDNPTKSTSVNGLAPNHPPQNTKITKAVEATSDDNISINTSSTTPTCVTSIASIVSPIVIPSFKVGMGSLNKQGLSKEDGMQQISTNSSQGIIKTSQSMILRSYYFYDIKKVQYQIEGSKLF